MADGFVFVFTCNEGQYQTIFAGDTCCQFIPDQEEDEGIRTIIDMNQDGIDEILLSYIGNIGNHWNLYRSFQILSWNGNQFVDLIPEAEFTTGISTHVADVYNGEGDIEDTNGDGYLELVLSNGIEHYYVDGGPQRVRTDVWAWNGMAFTLERWEYTPPEYRIHAVWDGDAASLFGDYDAALVFYQQAIFDEQLLGWSQGQSWQPVSADWFWQDYTPPPPDPEERPRLEAYARYRIMLLHVIREYMTEAKIVYDTLQEKFPSGSVGHPYAQLATIFWDEYNQANDVATACDAAVVFAADHEDEILRLLGFTFYNLGNYEPTDICPFK
jgi:hypothetical protein